jgi:hypothetical protein
MTLSFFLSLCFFSCSLICWLHVRQIIRDQTVKGVSLVPSYVFMLTNIVEMVYFYQKLDWWSAVGALSMLLSNAAWVGFVFHYMQRDKAKAREDAPSFRFAYDSLGRVI